MLIIPGTTQQYIRYDIPQSDHKL